jgi:hypothetical protein
MRCIKTDTIWKQFHDAGFRDLWYAHPGGDYDQSHFREPNPRWHAGIWTGPQNDLICIKICETNKEANKFLSPSGWTPEEATVLAVRKKKKLAIRKIEKLRAKK